MKKSIIPLFVLLSLLFSVLYSCKSESGKTNSTQKENVPPESTPKESTSSKENNSASKEVKLIPEEQKKLNVFFSNFSEVNLKPFTIASITDEDLINFGVLHNYKNNFKLFEKVDNSNVKIKEDNISASIQKYFDRKINSHKSTSDYKYKNGYYFVPLADGEAFTFSQVEKMNDIGNDKYIAYINVYTASSGWTGNVHAAPKEWTSDENDKPELSEKFKATIKKSSGTKGEDVYTLIDYIKQ
ncbi:MAG: hypothetical protein WC358_09115 [Ignavibacteria bacterium]|jgi:spore coat protein CotF